MHDESDAELVVKCQRQLPYVTSAFEDLVRRHQPNVLRTCQRLLDSQEDAEEACQDSFLKVFHGLPRFEFQSTFRTWLFRIVANTCTDFHRRNKARRRHVQSQLEFIEPAALTRQPNGLEFGGLEGPVGEALDILGDSDRQVLVLRHIAELSIRELSETLQLSESAAKMRLYRAEQRLREAYQRTAQGD